MALAVTPLRHLAGFLPVVAVVILIGIQQDLRGRVYGLLADVLLVAAGGALLIFVEAWWGFRLIREPGGTLWVRRGLLTTRSVSLGERRLRGAKVSEAPLLRLGRGARLIALATGLGGRRAHGRSTLLPPAPRAVAHHVAAAVLAESRSPTSAPLRQHPQAALRRRLVRAVFPAVPAVPTL